METKVNSLETKIASLEAKLESSKTAGNDHSAKLETENNRLASENAKFADQIEEFENVRAEWERKTGEMKKRIEELAKDKERLMAEGSNSNSKTAEIEGIVDSERAKSAKLVEEIASLKKGTFYSIPSFFVSFFSSLLCFLHFLNISNNKMKRGTKLRQQQQKHQPTCQKCLSQKRHLKLNLLNWNWRSSVLLQVPLLLSISPFLSSLSLSLSFTLFGSYFNWYW